MDGTKKKKRLLLTKEGLDRLRKKLDEITAIRHRVMRELRSIDKGDIDELHLSAQVRHLEHTEIEATQLSALLQRVEPVIKPTTPSRVGIGCTVSLQSNGTIAQYTIVSPLEIDIENNKISDESLLGRAVLGKKVGDAFSITTPRGAFISFRVISIT